MNNPFDYTPDKACDNAFYKLIAALEELKKSSSPDDTAFINEIESGKMLGVLIATDDSGQSHTLYAFSGQIPGIGFYLADLSVPCSIICSRTVISRQRKRKFHVRISRFRNSRMAGYPKPRKIMNSLNLVSKTR